MDLRIAGITKDSVVDGPGLRLVIFTQGCPHNCQGCHNPQTHDQLGGRVVDTGDMVNLIDSAKLIRGVTFSGGEPFLQAGALAEIANHISSKDRDIVTYTGFLFEELLAMGLRVPAISELLRATDILIDGRYVSAERDISLAFRGSRNQRLIDVKKSLQAGKVILWEDPAAKIWA